MNHKKSFLFLVASLVLSTAHAFTINVSFLRDIPSQVDFSYAISTGNCFAFSTECHFSRSKVGGMDGELFMEYIKDMNVIFKTMTPVADKFHIPTNYVQIKIVGQPGLCHIDVLGKTNISVRINKDGNCIK